MAPTKGEVVSSSVRGHEAFERAYLEWFGERWPVLCRALRDDVKKVTLLDPFDQGRELKSSLSLHDLYAVKDSSPLPVSIGPSGLGLGYELDVASVLAALALPLSEGQKVLDLCAAPGGKALTLIYKTRGRVEVALNELSNDRLQRLKAVCHDHLPEEVRQRIRFTKRDGSRWPAREGEFDAILIDAPCSGERHLLSRPSELEHWTLKRSKGLAIRQHALLCSALEATRVGGHILYSTCALSPLENDGVIEKFLARRKGRVRVCEAPLWIGHRTEHGVQIAPDKFPGAGPIYYALVERIE